MPKKIKQKSYKQIMKEILKPKDKKEDIKNIKANIGGGSFSKINII